MSFLPPVAPAYRATRQRAIARSLPYVCEINGAPLPLVANILTTYDRATDTERVNGLVWYAQAHELAHEISPDNVARGAGIIAALSPQLGWTDNVAAARNLVATGDAYPAGIGLFVERATAILNGAAPADVLGGRKVRSFYRNILAPDVAGPVTVDRHAVAVALGFASDSHAKALERPGTYLRIAGAYRTAARTLSLLPHELQAITWLCHRRELDETATGNLAAAYRAQRRNPNLSTDTEDLF